MAWFEKFIQTTWQGHGELWLDEAGNDAIHYPCSLSFDGNHLHYCWQYKDEEKKGSFILEAEHLLWSDSWHQATQVKCQLDQDAWGLFSAFYAYSVPDNPDWGWRLFLSQRPSGELVLQMSNVTPWGEEGRAVRMVFQLVE